MEIKKFIIKYINLNSILVTCSMVATIASAVAAVAAYVTALNAEKQAEASEVRQAIIAYTTLYTDLRNKVDYPAIANISDYNRSEPKIQSQIIVVDGLLVSVIDAMYRSNDARADQWAGFLKGIPGPLVQPNFDLDVYATERRTVDAIHTARAAIQHIK